MRKFAYFFILSLALSACGDNGGGKSLSGLEKIVTKQALENPETSINTFMEKIEKASYEEQGVYMYGMAVAREKMGDESEAINDFFVGGSIGECQREGGFRPTECRSSPPSALIIYTRGLAPA